MNWKTNVRIEEVDKSQAGVRLRAVPRPEIGSPHVMPMALSGEEWAVILSSLYMAARDTTAKERALSATNVLLSFSMCRSTIGNGLLADYAEALIDRL